jgi:hypothetical protein
LTHAVVAFAFGAPADLPSNKAIRELAEGQARELNCPVFTQLDVQVSPDIETARASETPGEPPPTLRIAREAVDWAIRGKIERLWVAAATPHRLRCLRDLNEAARERNVRICVIPIESPRHLDRNGVWFNPRSTQIRTRSESAWWSRERLLLRLPFWIYKRVAK